MSYRTEQAYCSWIKRYVIFYQMRHPRDMGRVEVESYLSHLVNVGNVSQSTHHQTLSALLFLYKEVLNIELVWLDEWERPTKPTVACGIDIELQEIVIPQTKGDKDRLLAWYDREKISHSKYKFALVLDVSCSKWIRWSTDGSFQAKNWNK